MFEAILAVAMSVLAGLAGAALADAWRPGWRKGTAGTERTEGTKGGGRLGYWLAVQRALF